MPKYPRGKGIGSNKYYQFSYFTVTAAKFWEDHPGAAIANFRCVTGKMSLHTKSQPDLSINVARVPIIGFSIPTSDPNFICHEISPPPLCYKNMS